ncbi:MAG: hypothetical protein OER90_12735 [Gemmatimonadota bacterium]|nr:hypothetical protein [Gemmatimonadota bacterium]
MTEMAAESTKRSGRGVRVSLWVMAVFVMLGAAVFQRLTGPTHSLGGSFEIDGREYRYSLTRSGVSTEDERVAIPRPEGETHATLYYKRHKTDDSLTAVPLSPDGDELVASLPRQPAAGKLEYTVAIGSAAGNAWLPGEGQTVVIRFKDPVPLWLLLPHVITMFFGILFGIRTGLAALFDPRAMPRLAVVTLMLLTVGGMVLGPLVQKLAFGALWTGFPFGYDLTDNKTLIMWLVWIAALVVLYRRQAALATRRTAVLAATVVMMAVYLIPHSLQGSELDYSQLDQGVAAEEAVTQG